MSLGGLVHMTPSDLRSIIEYLLCAGHGSGYILKHLIIIYLFL